MFQHKTSTDIAKNPNTFILQAYHQGCKIRGQHFKQKNHWWDVAFCGSDDYLL